MSDKPDSSGPSIQHRLRSSRLGHDLLTDMQTPTRSYSYAPVPESFPILIEVNAQFPGGSRAARLAVLAIYLRGDAHEESAQFAALRDQLERENPLAEAGGVSSPFAPIDRLDVTKSLYTDVYLFGTLSRDSINRLCTFSLAVGPQDVPLVHKIWSDHAMRRCVFESVRTIKCDAARAAFAAAGANIVWAVADTGVDRTHPHFHTHDTLTLPNGLRHKDFTATYPTEIAAEQAALQDADGHGTHVSGIIAGETVFDPAASPAEIHRETLEDENTTKPVVEPATCTLSGMAPRCKIVSLKVLQDGQTGSVSNLIAAIGYVQTQNDYGRNLKIHGINISLDYLFNPEWYATGASPLCVEVDRLVRCGVVVVVAAGNGGYGPVTAYNGTSERASHGGTISDPGNAALAITVGSTHRNAPHSFGVSYYSGKGPTADGRAKPDLVAPGERIISCARMVEAQAAGGTPFKEDSGTSMAAPHVSGAAAAFLSVRAEFKGQPERLKAILMQSATDLGRREDFQGAGMVDVMRALQSV